MNVLQKVDGFLLLYSFVVFFSLLHQCSVTVPSQICHCVACEVLNPKMEWINGGL